LSKIRLLFFRFSRVFLQRKQEFGRFLFSATPSRWNFFARKRRAEQQAAAVQQEFEADEARRRAANPTNPDEAAAAAEEQPMIGRPT
jgi:hypothetical protein